MGAMASQITAVPIVCSTACSGADQRKHQSSASLAFVKGILQSPVDSLTKGQLRGKCFHLMTSSWLRSFPTSQTVKYDKTHAVYNKTCTPHRTRVIIHYKRFMQSKIKEQYIINMATKYVLKRLYTIPTKVPWVIFHEWDHTNTGRRQWVK